MWMASIRRDPRVVPKARRLDKIAFEDMLELASQGAKVLQVRSVELGMVHNMPVFVRSSFNKPEDIDPHGTPPGTLICSEEEIMESHVVTGIAFSKDEAQISVRQIQDKPGVAASIFGPLAEANINVDMIVQNVSEDGKTTDLTFTVPASDYTRARDTITSAKAKIGYARLDSATDIAKISVIGSGMRSHAGVAAKAFAALAARNINIRAITTSEIKFSVLIDTAYTELAVHAACPRCSISPVRRFGGSHHCCRLSVTRFVSCCSMRRDAGFNLWQAFCLAKQVSIRYTA